MKFVIRTFVLLLLVNSLLLYIHFSDYGNASGQETDHVAYSQEIEVLNRPDGLYIRHHFIGLDNHRYEIIWPEVSLERSCYSADETSCTRLNENWTAVVEGEQTRQSISYQIPQEGAMEQPILFTEAFAELHRGEVESTILHITDETQIGGAWVSGLKQVGQKKMDLIEYSLFSGAGKLSDLYWQKKKPSPLYEGVLLTAFGESDDLEMFKELDEQLEKIDANHSTVIIDTETSPIDSNRFLIIEATNLEEELDVLLVNHMYSQFKISMEDHLLAEVLASLLSGEEVGSDQSRNVFNHLKEALDPLELEQFIDRLREMTGEVVDGKVLDNLVAEIIDLGTSYFAKNMESEKELYPFLLEEPRDIYINGIKDSEAQIILKEGTTFYPAKNILTELGYEIRSNEQSLYIENEANKFRFPLQELFYVLNEKKYNIVSTPFEWIENEFYFEESALIRLFHLDVNKSEKDIEIILRGTAQESGVVH